MTTTPHPLSITESEAPFLPETLGDLIDLAQRLEQRGHSIAKIQGCVGWVALKAAGKRDTTAPSTRSRYRKMLADLAEHTGPPSRRRSEAGVANLLAVAGVTATAAVGVATKNPRAAAMAVPALVYITYTAGDDEIAASPGGDSGRSLHTVCALPRRNMATSYTLDRAA